MQILLLVLLSLCGSAMAVDLGTHGPTFLIKERDAYDWLLNERLVELEKSGKIAELQEKMQNRAQYQIENPKGLALPQAVKNKKTLKSLVYTTPKDIVDSKGKVLFPKNTQVSPSELLPESAKALVFFDGNSAMQTAYALAQCSKNPLTKIILVAGKPLEFMEKHKVNVYFDQQQRLIAKFDINALPAKVYRKGSNLVIEEVLLVE